METLERLRSHFNPRSPYGERLVKVKSCFRSSYFNPRSPYGERPLMGRLFHWPNIFQSTLPLRGATRDRPRLPAVPRFQSTLPLRGATRAGRLPDMGYGDFNPRSPYGERPDGHNWPNLALIFQSTLPLRGATTHLTTPAGTPNFNPRSPYGERPSRRLSGGGIFFISIHAPLTGSDLLQISNISRYKHFNPRSPYGERLFLRYWSSSHLEFQSTLPLRGATMIGPCHMGIPIFQSTLPLRGATRQSL